MSRTDHHTPRRFRGSDDDPRTGIAGLGVSRDGLAEHCTMLERRARAELRGYVSLVLRASRAGCDLESVLEPDTRTRRRAHYQFW